jgi:NAD+ diphosphatase
MKHNKTRISPFSLIKPFTPGISPVQAPSTSTLWFTFHDDRLLIEQRTDEEIAVCSTPPISRGLSPIFSQYIGNYNSTDIYVAEVKEPPTLPETIQFTKLRSLFGKIDREIFSLAGRAVQIVQWNRDHKFCGRCGTGMLIRQTELAKNCPACGFISFPRLSPAVIMSIVRGKEILLARSPHFRKGMYSTLAGFVEPGETLEETVTREIREEVNVEVSDITYIGSQPWPFPHSLMIGFTTRYTAGDIQIDNKEIEDAQWFSIDNLPVLPTRMSIAYHLIELFINSTRNR